MHDNLAQLNQFERFIVGFSSTWFFEQFLRIKCRVIGLFTGNQAGKTSGVGRSYVMRFLSMHPVPKKNVQYDECVERRKLREYISDKEKHKEAIKEFLENHKSKDSATFSIFSSPGKCPECGAEVVRHKRGSKVFRFCSETLPGQAVNISEHGESAEVRNTQYPELKKWLPPSLIKKDITARSSSMILVDINGGKDIIVDFVSYNQSIQSTAGPQRVSLWYDEEPPEDFREEQKSRLLGEDGDEIFTLTPANHISWLYDEVFEKAKYYYRTDAICDFLNSQGEERFERFEVTDSVYDIAVIQAATDDNPTLDPNTIDDILGAIDDPDIYAIRRYGIFKQVSGRIFKGFKYDVHVIDREGYFPDGIPRSWFHARGVDYHPQTPWAYGQISLSPTNEAFIWGEFNPSPEKLTTRSIVRGFVQIAEDYKFHINLIDPESETIKKDTVSVRDDINRELHNLKIEDIGTGGYFSTWNTKGERGRDMIQERLKNARLCDRPFNNRHQKEDGTMVYLPTLWIFDNCKLSAKSMKQWRWGKENKPEQSWSHFNMVWEAIMKNGCFRPKAGIKHRDRPYIKFKGGKQ